MSRQVFPRLVSVNANPLQAVRLRQLNASFFARPQSRQASSTKEPKSKNISLEQPDKFRPPSHAPRLVKGRSRGSTFNGAYNQSSTTAEQDAQRNKRYPHMFPDEGTLAHRIITNRLLHVFMAIGVLIVLALVSWTQTFIKTSPFGHLMPSLSSIFYRPIGFFQDAISTLRLHADYNTEKVEFDRARNILDAKKRRLYRRAHGMEDLDRDEDQGVDVRNLVPWDDGLTKREREMGGLGANRIKMISAVKMDDKSKQNAMEKRAAMEAQRAMSEVTDEYFIRRREAELGLDREEDSALAAYKIGKAEEKMAQGVMTAQRMGSEQQQQTPETEQQPQKRRKLWFGIW